jgi:hypothetical protein
MFLPTPRGQLARDQIEMVGDSMFSPVPRGYGLHGLQSATDSARGYAHQEVETAQFDLYSCFLRLRQRSGCPSVRTMRNVIVGLLLPYPAQ